MSEMHPICRLGTFERLGELSSDGIAQRRVDVWFPPEYGRDHRRRFPTLYMHDGQNLFRPADSFVGVAWNIHAVLAALAEAGSAQPAIIVAIWNTPQRVAEYMPAKALDRHADTVERTRFVEEHGEPLSDAYLKFIVYKLKPVIDERYRTRARRQDTHIMGSSMGGLISAYAFCEYPEVFANAGCLSTHWPVAAGAMIPYLEETLPNPSGRRIYFDHGTATLDAKYPPFQAKADQVMRRRGFVEGESWITQRYPGAEHSERAWQARVDVPLKYLLGTRS